MYNTLITNFYDETGCIPGDCTPSQIPTIAPLISTTCTTLNPLADNTQVYNVFNTESLETLTKRTCAFQSLEAGNYIRGKVNIKYTSTSANPLTDSVSGQTIPYAKFSNKASWDMLRIFHNTSNNPANNPVFGNSNATGFSTAPYSLGIGSLSSWQYKIALHLRASNQQTNGFYSVIGPYAGVQSPLLLAAVPSSLAKKLDAKFDDGLPYSGSISGGQIFKTSSCNDGGIATWDAANVTASVQYLNTNNISTGCIMSFLLVPNL